MGLGLLGRGVGDAAWLARAGANLLVTDMRSAEQLAPSVAALAPYTGITFKLGGHALEDFRDCDLILKGAGVHLDSTEVAEARRHMVPVDMSASLFARIARIPLVGVTGTRGKSTVTALIHALLVADGRHVLLGGNVRGVSNLSLFDGVRHDSLGVFELDSWQCQGFGEERSLDAPGVLQGALSPSVAVFTTFLPDHLNYYKGSLEAYLADKAHIFLHQHEGDVLVVGRQALPHLEPYKRRIRSRVVVADEGSVPRDWGTKLLGEHNRYNIGIALTVARELGVADEVARTAIASFEALPGRTQFVRELDGVRYYNDTNATTPDATLASLRALDATGKKNVVLIMGGADKKLDMSTLVRELPERVKAVVLLKGTGTGMLSLLGKVESMTVDSLDEAIHKARALAQEGDCILFSPAFASFGMFTNEYERGERFDALVRELK